MDYSRFTERARQVVVLSQEEARTMKHGYIGSEHLLAGLLREEEGLAARALEDLGVTLGSTRNAITVIVGTGERELSSDPIPFTPRTKTILEMALREALSLGHNWIGTEHICLGLVREGNGVGARILTDMVGDLNRVRDEILRMLSGPGSRTRKPPVDVQAARLAAAVAENAELKAAARVLVAELSESWWAKAGAALRALERLTQDEAGNDV